MGEIKAIAKEIAAQLGRDWNDCGAYERQSLIDEAARQLSPTGEKTMNFVLVSTQSGRIASAEMSYTEALLKASNLNGKLGRRMFEVKPAN